MRWPGTNLAASWGRGFPGGSVRKESACTAGDLQTRAAWLQELSLLLFSCPVPSDSLRPHGLQHARHFSPSLSPNIRPRSCPSHRSCHPAISSSDALFSFCPQSFPASGTFPMSRLFASDDQNTRVSASASVLPVNIQD